MGFPSSVVGSAVAAGTCPLVEEGMPRICLQRLDVLCTYADPNYGFLWFWCRKTGLSQPREVLQQMHEEIAQDLTAGGALWPYAWAIARRAFKLPADTRPAGILPDHVPRPLSGTLGASDLAIGSLRLSQSFAARNATPLAQAERRRLIFGSDILCV